MMTDNGGRFNWSLTKRYATFLRFISMYTRISEDSVTLDKNLYLESKILIPDPRKKSIHLLFSKVN